MPIRATIPLNAAIRTTVPVAALRGGAHHISGEISSMKNFSWNVIDRINTTSMAAYIHT
jgi:hypothetical protein